MGAPPALPSIHFPPLVRTRTTFTVSSRTASESTTIDDWVVPSETEAFSEMNVETEAEGTSSTTTKPHPHGHSFLTTAPLLNSTISDSPTTTTTSSSISSSDLSTTTSDDNEDDGFFRPTGTKSKLHPQAAPFAPSVIGDIHPSHSHHSPDHVEIGIIVGALTAGLFGLVLLIFLIYRNIIKPRLQKKRRAREAEKRAARLEAAKRKQKQGLLGVGGGVVELGDLNEKGNGKQGVVKMEPRSAGHVLQPIGLLHATQALTRPLYKFPADAEQEDIQVVPKERKPNGEGSSKQQQ